ncbi:DUF6461 domain-containing protein [Streptosporangium subroseum]|uniref:DUF6461 domain-containing protein n=1 Tax=Streptosporangium subroseum TaxID=106412 RepID=UPI0030848527|nr:Lsr2 family protein [Streptosporangium subroseum]
MPDHSVSPLRVTRLSLNRELSRRMREWTRAQGLNVSMRGRVASEIVDAFLDANPDAREAAGKLDLVRAMAAGGVATPDDYDWQDEGPLGPNYTITFVRGLDEREALSRFGADPREIRPFTGDEAWLVEDETGRRGEIVRVVRLDGWAVVIERDGWRGVQPDLLCALSRQAGESVAVSRQDYAHHRFTYALDGQVITSFEPSHPLSRWGTDPDRLNARLRELGIEPTADDWIENAVPAALALASRLSGVVLTPAHLEQPLPGAPIPQG